jgi:integrase
MFFMAWSPVRRTNAGRFEVDHPGDYATSIPTTPPTAPKGQATISKQITDAVMRHIGIHMTAHQFRHFGATSYLEQHPEDFETARAILGHAWSKTTRIYAGSSSRRASRAYNQYLFHQREALKLLRPRRKRRG